MNLEQDDLATAAVHSRVTHQPVCDPSPPDGFQAEFKLR